MNDFADRIAAPMAVRSHLMNAHGRGAAVRNFRAPTGVHIERPDGSRGIALVDIEAVKDSDGNIIGAVNCFQDITERKGAEEREKILAREVDHRAKNLLALVQAAVQLTHARTVKTSRRQSRDACGRYQMPIRSSRNHVGREPTCAVWSWKNLLPIA